MNLDHFCSPSPFLTSKVNLKTISNRRIGPTHSMFELTREILNLATLKSSGLNGTGDCKACRREKTQV